MSANPFKVGDKVKCVSILPGTFLLSQGGVYTVVETGSYCIKIHGLGINVKHGWWETDRFGFVLHEPKFKKGDTVRDRNATAVRSFVVDHVNPDGYFTTECGMGFRRDPDHHVLIKAYRERSPEEESNAQIDAWLSEINRGWGALEQVMQHAPEKIEMFRHSAGSSAWCRLPKLYGVKHEFRRKVDKPKPVLQELIVGDRWHVLKSEFADRVSIGCKSFDRETLHIELSILAKGMSNLTKEFKASRSGIQEVSGPHKLTWAEVDQILAVLDDYDKQLRAV